MSNYAKIIENSLRQTNPDPETLRWILEDETITLLPLLQAAYQVRSHFSGNKVKIHILNNVQSGNCTEDCRYCAQSRNNSDQKDIYPMKEDATILEEAKAAYQSGAYRYCLVFSGRDLGVNRIERICTIVRKIKALYPMEICVSAGFLSTQEAAQLRGAGVNRYNHNLNTSAQYYGNICRSHEYPKRVETVHTARQAGLDICSGVIIGLGETTDDIFSMIRELQTVKANSVPVNFFLPISNSQITAKTPLTPIYCLKILALFRFALPQTELRIAAGREYHLRSLQALALYAVNSLFAQGYLTAGGESIEETRKMILDSGFEIEAIEY